MDPRFTASASIYRSATTYRVSPSIILGPKARVNACDVAGSTCCRPDSEVKTQHCDGLVGCNVASGNCEPCGGSGQVCCDGPYTGFSNKNYVGIYFDDSIRTTSCDAGLRCDATLAPDGVTWIGLRRCLPCGSQVGGPCCAPDNNIALGHCFPDAASGARLVCNNPEAGVGGTCAPCGAVAGQPPCPDGGFPCAAGLVPKNGVCTPCGTNGGPVCDRGAPCNPNAVPDRWFTTCVKAGQAGEPCLRGGQCSGSNLFCDSAKICRFCGVAGEPCCPPSAGFACYGSIPCQNGICVGCGAAGEPVCSGNAPCPNGGVPIDGWCRECGGEGQPCCDISQTDIVCREPWTCQSDNTCGSSQGPGGGSGGTWTTCSGAPYTINTQVLTVPIELSTGCILYEKYAANSGAEAVQCAQKIYGTSAVIADGVVPSFTFGITCGYFCNDTTIEARNSDGASRCLASTWPYCDISDEPCSS